MRTCFFISLFLLSVVVTNAQDKLSWEPERPLSWSDFKGEPDRRLEDAYFAMTFGSLGYDFRRLSARRFVMEIDVYFDCESSWHVAAESTASLLSHEQRHFDIYELYARIFVKRITESNALRDRNFSKRIRRIFDQTFSELKGTQIRYDEETDHSRNKDAQKIWDTFIQQKLVQYADFSRKEIPFSI